MHLRPARESKTVARDDVRLQILGRLPVPARPGQVNVLWQISHPDYVRREVYAREDLVFIASDQFAAHMASQVEIPVRPLHQATDPRRSAPSKEGKPHELLFVANSRNANRHILEDLLPTDHELAVYGRNWTPARLDPRYLVGEHIPNEELAAYGAASIVLNDHWPDMEREGFLSNRLYDASAAGAFVISDEIDGIEEEFDGGIVTYRDRTHLRQLVERYLAQPDDRAERAARARAAVLERHTFDDRARVLVAAIEPLLRRPGGPLS